MLKAQLGLAIVLWGSMPNGSAASGANAIYPDNPAHIDDLICVSEHNIACFSPGSTRAKWVSNSSQALDYPVLTKRLVLAGSATGIWAFDRFTGQRIWHSPSNARAFSPTVLDTTAFAPTESGQLVALNLADGRKQWTQSFEGWIYAPAVVDNKLITGGRNNELIALAPATGKILWRIALTQELVYRPVPGANFDVIATTFGGEILSVSAADGSVRWRAKDEVASFSPTLAAGRLFFVGLDKNLHARDANSGRLLWRKASRFTGSAVHAGQTRLFALNETGDPVILDARSGLELATLTDHNGTHNTSITPVLIDQTLFSFTTGVNAGTQPGTAIKLRMKRHAVGPAAN